MKTVGTIRRENLELLAIELGSMDQVAALSAASPVYLSQIRTQAIDAKTGKPRQMGGVMARRLEKAFNKPDGWMDQQVVADGPRITATPVIQNDTSDVVIREFDTGGSMGRGLVLAEQPGVIKEWRVSDRWAQENIHRVTGFKNLAIVTGFGPSMQPLFNPGDPLLVDCGIKRADVDGVYFFRVGDEGFVKQLQRIPTSQGLILRAKSYNQLYDPFEITGDMDFEVFARVVKVWRGEEF